MRPRIEISTQQLARFCKKHGIRKLAFFGSVLRDDFGPKSDVDILIEFEPHVQIGYIGLARLERELSRLLGRRADLHTPEGLSPYMRDAVLQEASVLYEQTG